MYQNELQSICKLCFLIGLLRVIFGFGFTINTKLFRYKRSKMECMPRKILRQATLREV